MNKSHHAAHPEKRSRLAMLFMLGVLLTVPLVLYGAFLSAAGANTPSLPAAGRTSGQIPTAGCCSAEEEDSKPHLLAASYYSVKNNLSAKLLLNNKGPRKLEVKPMLFSMGGERYGISPITVDGNSFQMIDMSEWIEAAGPKFREGSIQVFHLGRDLVLGSQVYLVNEKRSLSFEEKLVEPATFHSSRLQGLWWLPSQNGEVLLAISNTSDLPVTVKAKADGTKPVQKASVTLELGPHETRLLDVEHDIFGDNRETGDNRQTMSRFGALFVEHNGQSGTVIARAMAQDAAEGYSLAIQFLDPSASRSTKLQGAGLRLREAGHEAVKPVVVAHNAGAFETTITGQVPYRLSNGTTAVVLLPEVRLPPGETTTINVAEALRASGVPADEVTAAGLEFEHTNDPGSVMISAFSVSESGNQLFRVPLWDIAAQRSATGGYPWYIDGSSSTYVHLKNVTDEPQDYTFQLGFAGGVYSLGLKTVEPRQAITLDIRALRDQQVPDEQGVTIPATATRGQIIWSVRGPDGLAMIGRSEQVDEARGLSSNYACQNCCPNSVNNVFVDPPTSPIIVGSVTAYTAKQEDRTCYGQVLTPYSVNNANWSSSNTSVATVTEGQAHGQGPGGAGIQASWLAYYYYSTNYPLPPCSSGSYTVNPTQPITVDTLSVLVPNPPVTESNGSPGVIAGGSFTIVLQARSASGDIDLNNSSTVSVVPSRTLDSTEIGMPSSITLSGGQYSKAIRLNRVSNTERGTTFRFTPSGGGQIDFPIYTYFQVIATLEGLLGGTTACGHVITSADHFVALPATGLCNTAVVVRNAGSPLNADSTTVREVGPWFPNTPGPGNSNTCSGGNDLYWNTGGVPRVLSETCDSNNAAIDLANGTASSVSINGLGSVLWRFD